MELMIDDEFKALCPPLSDDERNQLAQNIEIEGILDPIKVWDGIVIDGHNRYEIAQEQGVGFTIKEMEFVDRAEVLEWIILNQLGRRNLDPQAAAYLRGKLYNQRKQPKGGNKKVDKSAKSRGKDPNPQIDGLATTASTASEVAAETGVSKATVERNGKFAEAVDKLGPRARQIIESKRVKASPRDVERLADLGEEEQSVVLETVEMGDAETIREAIDGPKTMEAQAAEKRSHIKQLYGKLDRLLDDLHNLKPDLFRRDECRKLLRASEEHLW